jgi:hypothetical protein
MDISNLTARARGDINHREKLMKTLITLSITLVFLVTIGCHPLARGMTGGELRDTVHMNRLSHVLANIDSGSDGIGGPSFDSGIRSFFN